jgi:hypothetical protein
MHTDLYARGYCRWKPIEPKDMKWRKPGILLPDIHSEEMPYGYRGFICRDLLLMPDAMDVAHADRRSRRIMVMDRW